MSRVFYNSLYRLASNAKFTDGRAAVTSMAKALGFATTQQLAVTDAFNAYLERTTGCAAELKIRTVSVRVRLGTR